MVRGSFAYKLEVSATFSCLQNIQEFVLLISHRSLFFSCPDAIRFTNAEVQFDQRDGRNICVRFREFGGQDLEEHHDQLQW